MLNRGDWLSEAVFNNAKWCAAIAASHNIASDWRDSIWFSEHPMPPLYPNMVTLTDVVESNQYVDHIDPLLQSGWAIKDSFKMLQLEDKGFAIAFDACWYCLIPGERRIETVAPVSNVNYVTNQSELNLWEKAWGEKSNIFKPSLLLDDAIEFLYKEKNGQIVAGLATNQSGESIGISNAFGEHISILDCVNYIADKNPSKGIVGYGDSAEVTALSKIGFCEVGELRIWFRH